MEIKHRIELPLLMKHLGLPMIGVECGVAEGNNATHLLKAGLQKIYLVDNWATIPDVVGDGNFPQDFHNANYQSTIEMMSQFDKSRYVILKGLSSQVCHLIPDDYVSLVYIDANHSVDGVRADIESYLPKLVAGGILAFHDYNQPGVNQAVNEFATSRNLEIHYIPEDTDSDAGIWLQINLD